MKTYGDLDLKAIREAADLDFAHFTYINGMCSCCYGPTDMPSIYWKDRKVKEDDYTFILFKNANNGSGQVKKKDIIKDRTFISWDMSEKQLNIVCMMLEHQLGDEFVVEQPEDENTCIIINRK